MPHRTHRIVFLLAPILLLLFLLSFPLRWAQAATQAQTDPTPGPPPEISAEPVTYSGIVLSPAQTALPGVYLSAYPTDPAVPGNFGYGATTDDAGRFVLQLVPTVPYRIMVCVSEICYYYHPDGLKPRPDDGAVITPQVGENRSDLLIRWLEPAVFSGRVTGTDAQGISSINITAEVASQDLGATYQTQTQADGTYTLTVPAGQVYRISAAPALPDQPYQRVYYQNVTDPAQAVSFDTRLPGATSFPGIDFQLEALPSFYVSGTIRDQNAQPLQGITVYIQDQTNSGGSSWSSTDAQGRYRVRLEPGVSYTFEFYGSSYPSVYYNGSGNPPVYELAERISGAAGEERTIDYQYQAPATFSGKVTNLAGDALEGVIVAAYEKTTGSYMYSIVTQADGSFALILPGGYDYSLSAGPAYGAAPLRKEYYPDQIYAELAIFFNGAPGAQYTGLTFVLDPAFRITGKVTGPDGSGLAAVPVQVDAQYEGGSGSVAQTTTDGNGAYQVSVLDPVSKVTLSACAECAGYSYGTLFYTASGGLPLSSLAEIIVPQGGQVRSDVDFHFRQPITFSGSVQDTHGSPLQGITVSVQEGETRQEIARATTGADGRYTVPVPPGMTMRLAAWPGDLSQRLHWEYYDNQTDWGAAAVFDGQTPGAVYAGRNFILEPLPTTYVSGVVRGPDGSPLAGVKVNGSPLGWDASYSQAATGADGRYRLTLDAGQPYTISTCAGCTQLPYADMYYHQSGNTPLAVNAQLLTGVDGQERSGVDFQFSKPVVISGRVTGPDGSPLENSNIHAEDTAGNVRLGGASTDAQGRYTLYLEPGYPLRVSVYPYISGASLTTIYYPNQYRSSQAHIFEGAPGQHFESIDFHVEPLLTIKGRVSSPSGAPLFSVEVKCEQDGENSSCGSDSTNSMGVYTLHVQPGRPYRISAGGQVFNGLVYSRVYSNGTPLRSKAETLIGGAGETLSGVDFHLVPAVTVSGHVYAPDGRPLKQVWVTVLGENDQDELGSAASAADGSYSVSIHPGLSYTVKADPGIQPYPMEYYSDAPTRAQAATLTGDNRQGIDFTLNPPAVLRGAVTITGGTTPFIPIVMALDAASGEVLGYANGQEGGSYIMYLRSGHTYHIQVVPSTYDFLVEYWDNRHARAQAAVVQMGVPGSERVINLQVDPLAVAAQAVAVDKPFTYTLPDAGPDLTFSAGLANGADLPAWLHFDPLTRTFSGTPGLADAGQLNVRITVSYDGGRQLVRTFMVTVTRTTWVFLPAIRR